MPSQKLLNLYTSSEGSQSSLIVTFSNMYNGDKIALTPIYSVSIKKLISYMC